MAGEKNNALQDNVRRTKESTNSSDRKLSLRFRKTVYWIRNTLGRSKYKIKLLSRGGNSRKKFLKVHERAEKLIE
jgi:hypothetical protein